MQPIVAMVAAELRNRSREASTYVMLLFVAVVSALVLPTPNAPYATLTAGGHRVLLASPTAGALAGVLTVVFLALVTLVLLAQSVYLDRLPFGVGTWLRTSPASNVQLLVARWISGTLYVESLVFVCGVVALVTSAFHGIGQNPAAFLRSYAVVSLALGPMAAGVGLLIDNVAGRHQWLRGTLVAVCWLGALALGAIPGGHLPDPLSLNELSDVAAVSLGHHGLTFGITPNPGGKALLWSTFPISYRAVANQVLLAASGIVALLSSLAIFSRFAPLDGEPQDSRRPRKTLFPTLELPGAMRPLWLSRVGAELRLMLVLDRGLLASAALAALGTGLVFSGMIRIGEALLLLLPLVFAGRITLCERAEGTGGIFAQFPAYVAQYTSWKSAAIISATLLFQLPLIVMWHDRAHLLGLAVGDIVLSVALVSAANWFSSSLIATILVGIWWYLFALNQSPDVMDPANLSTAMHPVLLAAYLAVAVSLSFVPIRAERTGDARA